jgi:hypothetical protein
VKHRLWPLLRSLADPWPFSADLKNLARKLLARG